MHLKKLVVAVSATCVAACSSAPSLVTPSGYSRVPVNSESSIDSYRLRTAEEEANRLERSALGRQVTAMNRQIAEMKAAMAVLAAQAAEGNDGPKAQAAPLVEKNPLVVSPAAITEVPPSKPLPSSARESVEVREQAVIFRLTFPTGKTVFDGSETLRDSILIAAKNADHIEIRGRTDADHDNEIDRRIALERALQARLFLVRNGVHPSKVRITSMASGGYLTDNSTPAGKARNRRVEIEAMDLDTSAYRVTALKMAKG